MEHWIADEQKELMSDVGLLVLRLWTGLAMFLGYGLVKVMDFPGQIEERAGFLGMPGELAAGLLVFAEVVCALLVAAGFLTRAAAVPIVIAMLIAAFVGLAGEDFVTRVPALFFAMTSLTFVLTGPGRFSVDRLVEDRLTSS